MASPRIFLTAIDLKANELLNVKLQLLGADPGSLPDGLIYHRSDLHHPFFSNNGVAQDLTDALKLEGQAGAFYLARANHTGTQLAVTISDFDTQVRTSKVHQLALATASFSMNSQLITNLSDPVSAQDAATKAYVDAMSQGIDVRGSVRVATTANGTLASAFENGDVIDGVTLVTGDRLLIKDQSTGAENGIYVVAASGAPARAADANTSAEVTSGMYAFVEEGTVNADSGWVLSTNNPITLGSTALVFVQFTGAGAITAGAGLTKTGNTIDIITASSARIVVNADSIDLATVGSPGTGVICTIDAYGRVSSYTDLLSGNGIPARTAANTYVARTMTGTSNRLTVTQGDGVAGNPTFDISTAYVGQASITTLGTITTGVWTGTDIAVADGGTGASTAAGARTNLGATGKYSATFGDGAAQAFTFTQGTHGLAANAQMLVGIYEVSTGNEIEADVSINNSNGTVTINTSTVPTSGQYRLVLIG